MFSLISIGLCSLAFIGATLAKKRADAKRAHHKNRHYVRVYMLRNPRISIDQVLEEIMSKGI
jgi:hypothetical protein